jgi:hypothetical protein
MLNKIAVCASLLLGVGCGLYEGYAVHCLDEPGPCKIRAEVNRDTIKSTRYKLECSLRLED